MQATRTDEKAAGVRGCAATAQPQRRLRDKKVRDLISADKKRLVEVPYTASLADTMNALMANRVMAAPPGHWIGTGGSMANCVMAAPPGHWIGTGGSMILESDKQTGAARKQYIGVVTMFDVVAHIVDRSRVAAQAY